MTETTQAPTIETLTDAMARVSFAYRSLVALRISEPVGHSHVKIQAWDDLSLAIDAADDAAASIRMSHTTAAVMPDQPPVCPDHREAQHRDNKPPWCDSCGWRHGEPARRYGNGRVVA